MARKGSTGEIRVWFVPTITSTAAPTVAEITAGTDLTPFLTRDGLDTPQGAETIDVSDASSRQNKSAPGTYGGDVITLKCHRDSVNADDDAWTTLVRGTEGYIVVRRFGGSSVAVAASQKVEVYPGEVSTRQPDPIAANEDQKFTTQFAVNGAINDSATVAA